MQTDGLPEVVIIDAVDALKRMEVNHASLIDVRETDEREDGFPSGSIWLRKSFLEIEVQTKLPDQEGEILLICASGLRSKYAAQALLSIGYRNVRSVGGGFREWQRLGLPTEKAVMLSARQRKKFARQISLDGFGDSGQIALQSSRVLIVGIGGLGCPAALYLASSGVGTLCLVDADVVELSNLHRQIMFGEQNIGQPKVKAAAKRLTEANSDLVLHTVEKRLDAKLAADLIPQYDVVLDCSDNFETRHVLNIACVKAGKPLVHGSLLRYEGHVSVYWPKGGENSACYACSYPEVPSADFSPTCSEAGIIGALPGLVGVLQALEVIKLICGIGAPLVGKTLAIDALTNNFSLFEQFKEPACLVCGNGKLTEAE